MIASAMQANATHCRHGKRSELARSGMEQAPGHDPCHPYDPYYVIGACLQHFLRDAGAHRGTQRV